MKKCLKNLSDTEHEQLFQEVQTEDVYPILNWAPNPLVVKATFNFIAEHGTVTYEDLREHLVDLEYADTEEGKYNIGIISVEEDDPIFNTTGGQDADTEITLHLGSRSTKLVLKHPSTEPRTDVRL